MNVLDFAQRKNAGVSIAMLTCYDAYTASIMSSTAIDCLLVGDSLSMVIYGEIDTLSATPALMEKHTRAVRRGAPSSFIITDMPFLSTRKGIAFAVETAGSLLQAGANAVKIESCTGNEAIIRHLVESGIPVMGHVGLTPQFYNSFGGFKGQGKTEDSAQNILEQAIGFQEAGAFAVVLECIPSSLAQKITETLVIPTIGIGSGSYVNGQVLVFHDLVGLSQNQPSFAHSYLEGKTLFANAITQFAQEVHGGSPV